MILLASEYDGKRNTNVPQEIKSGSKQQLLTILFLARAFTVIKKGCSSRICDCWSCRSKHRCLIERTPSFSLLFNILSVTFWNKVRLRPYVPMIGTIKRNFCTNLCLLKFQQLLRLTKRTLRKSTTVQLNIQITTEHVCPVVYQTLLKEYWSWPLPLFQSSFPVSGSWVISTLLPYLLWFWQYFKAALEMFFMILLIIPKCFRGISLIYFKSKEMSPFFWEEQTCKVWLNNSLLPLLFP